MISSGSLALVTPHAIVGKPDARGPIREAECKHEGGYLRTTMIENLRVDEVESRDDGFVRRGDHSHPGIENFVVVAGSGTLYTAHKDTPADILRQPFVMGDQIVIPADVVHTFMCRVGTVLVAITNWPFDPATSTVACRLNV